jgi:hypothetical protein
MFFFRVIAPISNPKLTCDLSILSGAIISLATRLLEIKVKGCDDFLFFVSNKI